MTSDIKVGFLSYRQIGKISADLLNTHNLGEKIPIDIEKLLDNIFQINIITFHDLYKVFDINAFTSSDLEKIYIDEYLHSNLELQYRFTLAHELGHIILHKIFYEQFKIKDIDSYINFLSNIDDKEYGYLEYQANCFAGYFLVPSNHLEEQFKKHLKNTLSFITKRFKGVKRKDYLEITTIIIAKKMSPVFNVHYKPIQIRIYKNGLWRQIPQI